MSVAVPKPILTPSIKEIAAGRLVTNEQAIQGIQIDNADVFGFFVIINLGMVGRHRFIGQYDIIVFGATEGDWQRGKKLRLSALQGEFQPVSLICPSGSPLTMDVAG